ncbi:MAG: ribonuclease III [Simkaniaceae bacterium]|nr:ribonuclease III [Candidatus Sacchlamyda saccharinae]
MELSEIESRLGYTFQDQELLKLAFTHRSYFNEHRGEVEGHNERLEFLGDSVLGLIISSYLYTQMPAESEGHLSHLRAHLVGADGCVRYTKQLQLEEFLLLGKGESVNVGRGRDRILADLFEAIVGAIYLDGGLESAREFILLHFEGEIQAAMETPLRNWKAELQDYSQKKFQRPPDYVVLEEKGPPHSRIFVISARIGDDEMGQGEGASKKLAEQAAAEDALRHMEKEDG